MGVSAVRSHFLVSLVASGQFDMLIMSMNSAVLEVVMFLVLLQFESCERICMFLLYFGIFAFFKALQ